MKQTRAYSELVKRKAAGLGFDACGIAPVHRLNEEESHLKQWLNEGLHGKMGYMANHFEKRLDPEKLVDNARSVISVLLNYFPSDLQKDPKAPVVSRYAYGTDYHFVIKDKLKSLLNFIQKEISECEGRPFVDSAPVLDRAWAKEAGLGWIGKNTCLISPIHGSWVFIGELIIDLELEYDNPFGQNRCGSCTRCIDACPTGAIISGKKIDARKCISYLTIENRDEIPEIFRGKFQNRVFGCDICQEVCPWNRKASPCDVPEFLPDREFIEMPAEKWLEMDKSAFKQLFKGTPLERAGFKGLRRNIGFLNRPGEPLSEVD
jgi:epoxyqueuosine reductase